MLFAGTVDGNADENDGELCLVGAAKGGGREEGTENGLLVNADEAGTGNAEDAKLVDDNLEGIDCLSGGALSACAGRNGLDGTKA